LAGRGQHQATSSTAVCANGHANPTGENFCRECGAPIKHTDADQELSPSAVQVQREGSDSGVGRSRVQRRAGGRARAKKPFYRRPVILIPILVLGAAVVVGVALSGSDESKESVTSGASSENGGGGSSATVPTPADAPDELNVTSGFTQLAPDAIGNSYVTYAVIVENPNKDQVASSVNVSIAMYDAANTVVGTDSHDFTLVPPRQRAATARFTSAASVARIEVTTRVNDWHDAPESVGGLSVEGLDVSDAPYGGGKKITGTIASTFDNEVQKANAVAIFYNAANELIGGSADVVDAIPPAGSAAFEVSTVREVPNVDHVEVIPTL
jgi:hypothetical protein